MKCLSNGPYVQMRSWWSLLHAIAHHDSNWERWDDWFTSLLEIKQSEPHDIAICEGPPVETQEGPALTFPHFKTGAPLEEVIDASMPAQRFTPAEPHLSDEASAARVVALVPSLCSFHNYVNMHVMLIGRRALLSRQCRLACCKTSIKSQWGAISSP